MIKKLNKLYDGIKEPFRFFTALLIAVPTFILVNLNNPVLRLVGAGYLFALLLLRIPYVVMARTKK